MNGKTLPLTHRVPRQTMLEPLKHFGGWTLYHLKAHSRRCLLGMPAGARSWQDCGQKSASAWASSQQGDWGPARYINSDAGPLSSAAGSGLCRAPRGHTEIGALFTGSWKASLPTSLVNLQYIKDFCRFREGQLYSLKPYFEKIKR